MTIPLQISFSGGLTSSAALRARIEREAQKLEKFQDRIVGCHVTVTGRSGRRRHGELFGVRLQLSMPGARDVIVDRNPPKDHAHEDAYVAVRDAFNAARRRLQDQHRRMQGKIKLHAAPSAGRVTRLHDDGYGFIECPDGREVYFHRNALKNAQFGRLRKGAAVRFTETEIDGRIQATTVHVHRPA
ncbi:MAG TPA: HPF/RaiA family ribosome-associated protein [Hyphomonadaceae bacterium]|jgi:cold shock CspA family protein/ribosome-associated translation inhibitor RaiA